MPRLYIANEVRQHEYIGWDADARYSIFVSMDENGKRAAPFPLEHHDLELPRFLGSLPPVRLTQVAGASLLLFRKTSLLAALLMAPVMANILLINMFILVNDYGPYFISALILISLLSILWHQRQRLVSAFWSSQLPEPSASRRTHRWIRGIIVAVVLGILISGSVLQHYFPKR